MARPRVIPPNGDTRIAHLARQIDREIEGRKPNGTTAARMRIISAAQRANRQPGTITNPYGRKGKDGTKGKSLKHAFAEWLAVQPVEKIDRIWEAVARFATKGNETHIRMLLALNDETMGDNAANNQAQMPNIVIHMPAKEGSESVSDPESEEEDISDDITDEELPPPPPHKRAPAPKPAPKPRLPSRPATPNHPPAPVASPGVTTEVAPANDITDDFASPYLQ